MDPGRLLPSGTDRSVSLLLVNAVPLHFLKATRPVGTSPNKDRLHQATPAVTGTHRSDYNLLRAPSVELSNLQVVIPEPPLGHYNVNFYCYIKDS